MRSHERGNATIGVILGSAFAGLLYLQNMNQDVANQANLSRGNKLRSETQEASLYALSVASQLLTPDKDTQRPRLAFANLVDPNVTKNFELKPLATIPNGPVSFQAPARISVEATSGITVEEKALDNLFANKDFNAFKAQKNTAPVGVEIAGIEPFSTGFGISRVLLNASTTLNDGRLEKRGGLRAQIDLPVPDATCSINVYANGATVPNEGHTAALVPVEADMACSGVVLNATLMVGSDSGLKPYDIGPVTKANSYESVVPHMFPSPIKIDALGMVEFSGTYTLVDGTVKEIPSKKVAIDAPPSDFVDIGVCLHKCTSCPPDYEFGWNNCTTGPVGQFFRPFGTNYKNYLPWPAINGPLNGPGPEADAERTKYALWVKYNTKEDMRLGAILFMSLAYPRYPNILVCQRDGVIDWMPVGFDPKNNCEETPIADRSYIGCLDPDSQITVAPGRTVPIKSLRVGHVVLNPITQKSMRVRHVVAGPEKKPMNKLLTADGMDLIMTGNHPVLTALGIKLAANVQDNDQILWRNQWVIVHKNISFMPAEGQKVWNITLDGADVDEEHWIEANGMVVGDLWMQERMAGEANAQ